MKLLLAAATEAEISPLLQHLGVSAGDTPASRIQKGNLELLFCITGVGMMATAYHLTKALTAAPYDLALQVGVGGSFLEAIDLGELVFTQSEQYGDLGAEDRYNFLDVFDLGLLGRDEAPFSDTLLHTPAHPLHDNIPFRRVRGLTVNTVSGSDFTIKARQEKFACEVESMEGLPFHYICLKESIPFAQVRAISNYVTPRDRESWKMKEAIINLNTWLIDFIDSCAREHPVTLPL